MVVFCLQLVVISWQIVRQPWKINGWFTWKSLLWKGIKHLPNLHFWVLCYLSGVQLRIRTPTSNSPKKNRSNTPVRRKSYIYTQLKTEINLINEYLMIQKYLLTQNYTASLSRFCYKKYPQEPSKEIPSQPHIRFFSPHFWFDHFISPFNPSNKDSSKLRCSSSCWSPKNPDHPRGITPVLPCLLPLHPYSWHCIEKSVLQKLPP